MEPRIYITIHKVHYYSMYEQNQHEPYIFGQNPRRDQVPKKQDAAITPGDSEHISGKTIKRRSLRYEVPCLIIERSQQVG